MEIKLRKCKRSGYVSKVYFSVNGKDYFLMCGLLIGV